MLRELAAAACYDAEQVARIPPFGDCSPVALGNAVPIQCSVKIARYKLHDKFPENLMSELYHNSPKMTSTAY